MRGRVGLVDLVAERVGAQVDEALLGLALAVTCIAAMERVTDQPLVLMATSLGAFGVMWVAKYVILDKVMWRTEPSATT